MDIKSGTILILGGSGLVGQAVARQLIARGPRRVVLASLLEDEAAKAVEALKAEPGAEDIVIEGAWGDLFVPESAWHRPRGEVLDDAEARRHFIDDLYGELTDEVFGRSALGSLFLGIRPDIVVDSVNTAGAMAYQDVFGSVRELRERGERGDVDTECVERHLATLYLPQMIRHVQIALEGMRRAGTRMYVKIGTAGTGGMGLNIPFTHSEERPSRVLLAKAGLAGAQSLLLYLMARTPGAPAVKEVKPTAAISWKSMGFGPIHRGGRPLRRTDSTGPLPLDDAFGEGANRGWKELDEPLEGVFLDAGENGLFSLGEFETLTALGLMEFVTPEEIADNVVREIQGQPTGRDVVAALDAATMGPTFRAGVLRSAALNRMEEMEEQAGVHAVAYEMLGPPRLSKLLFEAYILKRLHGTLESAAGLDPAETGRQAAELLDDDADLRQRILSIGLPILLPDGKSLLRGSRIKIAPEPGTPLAESTRAATGASSAGAPSAPASSPPAVRMGDRPERGPAGGRVELSVVDRGWIDLRESNWMRWKDRVAALAEELGSRPGLERGSRADFEHGDASGQIRPGRLAAWIFRYEDQGERIKR
ncbi:MAG: short-chain dehydrogenase [Gemmatimonadota bacterium]